MLNNSPPDDQQYCWIFIDNSNLFIEGQKFYAHKQKWIVRTDPTFRIDFGRMVLQVASGLKILDIKLYGSEPPALDTLWQQLRKYQIDVKKFKRNIHNKEKEVDQQLVADAVEAVCCNKDMCDIGTFIFVTGDRDMRSAITKALEYNFRVYVFSYKSALSNKLSSIVHPNLTTIHIDNIIYDCHYQSVRWIKKVPPINSIVIPFRCLISEDKLKSIAFIGAKTFRLPCMYHWNPERGLMHLVFVPFSREDTGLYDFDHLYRTHINNFRTNIDNYLASQSIDKSCYIEISDTVSFRNRCSVDTSFYLNEDLNKFKFLSNDNYNLIDHDDENATTSQLLDCNNNVLISEEEDEVEEEGASEINSSKVSSDQVSLTDHIEGEEGEENNGEWLRVVRREKRVAQKYSFMCEFQFMCQKGKSCSHKHTNDEKRFFQHLQDKQIKAIKYKSQQCSYSTNCRFRNDPVLCLFAHGLEEARCYICSPRNGVDGILQRHWMSECPSNMTK